MITTASQTQWSSDIKINDLEVTGLTSASVIRFKTFTIDQRLIKKKIGSLSPKDQKAVKQTLKELI